MFQGLGLNLPGTVDQRQDSACDSAVAVLFNGRGLSAASPVSGPRFVSLCLAMNARKDQSNSPTSPQAEVPWKGGTRIKWLKPPTSPCTYCTCRCGQAAVVDHSSFAAYELGLFLSGTRYKAFSRARFNLGTGLHGQRADVQDWVVTLDIVRRQTALCTVGISVFSGVDACLFWALIPPGRGLDGRHHQHHHGVSPVTFR